MKTRLTINGVYEYNPHVFDLMELPDGMNKDVAIIEILKECGDFDLLFYSPDIIYSLMRAFSLTYRYKWEKLYKTLSLEYNPINNYDRTEETTEEASSEGKSAQSSDSSAVNSSKPFEDAWSDREKTVDNSVNNVDSSGSSALKRSSRIHGNIGVTTTQQMIRQEREIGDYSIYSVIAADFANYFCVKKY